jgi:hypothetical protein
MPLCRALGRAGTRPTTDRPHAAPTETGAPQNRPDRGRAHPDAQLAQLTLDPHTTPPGILPGQAHNQPAHYRIKRRPTQKAVPVTPLPPQQLAMPAKQRLRRNQEHRPTIPRQQPARSGQQQPVAPPQRRPLDPPTEHGQLVPEHRVLHLQRRDSRTPGKHPQQPPHRQVNQEEHHQPIRCIAQSGRANQSLRALQAPARVLTREPQHERTNLLRDRGPARSPSRTRPPSLHKLAMPTQQGVRTDEERPAPSAQ